MSKKIFDLFPCKKIVRTSGEHQSYTDRFAPSFHFHVNQAFIQPPFLEK